MPRILLAGRAPTTGGAEAMLPIIRDTYRGLGYDTRVVYEHDGDVDRDPRGVVVDAVALERILLDWKPDAVYLNSGVYRRGIRAPAGTRVIRHLHSTARAWAGTVNVAGVNTVIALGPVTAHGFYRSFKRFDGRVLVIPNPCRVPVSTRRPGREIRNLLWVGRWSSEKNPVRVAEIFADFLTCRPDARLLVLAGASESAPKISLSRWAKQRSIFEGKLSALGVSSDRWTELPHCDPVPHYDWADALFLPSAREGAPLCLLEAQARGLPVFAYAIGEIPTVAKGQGIIRPNGDLAKWMLGTTPDEYARMSRRGVYAASQLNLDLWRRSYGHSFKKAAEGGA